MQMSCFWFSRSFCTELKEKRRKNRKRRRLQVQLLLRPRAPQRQVVRPVSKRGSVFRRLSINVSFVKKGDLWPGPTVVFFVSLQTSHSGPKRKMRKNIVPASWLACLWSLGPICSRRKILLRSLPSYHKVFFFWLNYRLFHLDIVRARGFAREAFFERLELFWNLMRLVPMPRHLGNTIGRPTP